MMSMETIESELQSLYNNNQQQVEMEQLYNLLISKKSLQLQDHKQKVHSVCGAHIPKGELSFQCFDCSGDTHHMICVKCFDINKHINHKFVLKDTSGCCDCGDINSLKLGICDHHQGHAHINKEEILSQIPDEIQNNTQMLIKCLNNILNQLYLEIQPKTFILPTYVKIYDIAVRWNLKKIQEAIGIQDYYVSFCKALYFHQLLIKFISWFIEVDHKNIFLITTILQQIDTNSKQLILQDIFERQLVLESLGPYKGEQIVQIFYAFHADDQFKQLTHLIFMNNFHKFHKFYQLNQDVFNKLKIIHEKLENCDKGKNVVTLKATEYNESQEILSLQKHQLENEKNFVYLYITLFRGQHTQFCPQETIETFLNPKICSPYLQSLILSQQLYFQNVEYSQDFSYLHLNLLTFRIEIKWFKYAIMNSFKQILDDKFDSFQMTIISEKDYEDFQQRQFFLTQLLHSYNNVKKETRRFKFDKLVVQQNDLITVAILINYISLQLKIFNSMLKSLRSLMPKQIGKRNLSRIILYQCYLQLIQDMENYRNFEQIDDFYSDYINTEAFPQKQKEVYDAYLLLSLKLLKRPIVTNLIFIEMLILEYFDGQFVDKQGFLKHLMQVLRIECLKDLKKLFNYLLIECLQNFISFNFDSQKKLYFKYSNINNQLESIDLAFIKLFLFLFQQDGLLILDDVFQNFRIPIQIVASQIYNSILLNVISSDIDFWNVLQMLEEKIDLYPDQLKSTIHYAIINIFNQSSSLSYNEIKKYISQLKIATNQQIQNFVQEVCQLDQISKKFTLKKDVPQYFDPILFQKNTTIQGQFLDRLIDQRKSQEFITYGNYIQYKADEIIRQINPNANQIFFDKFLLLANKPFIQQLIYQIQQNHQQPIQTYQLLNYLIIILFKQQNMIDQEVFALIHSLAQQQNSNDQTCVTHMTRSSTLQSQNTQILVSDKCKMKNKYLQKQTKFNQQLDFNVQLEIPQEKYDENDYCQSCKLILTNNDRYTPILIQTFAKQDLYETMPTTLQNLLNDSKLNLFYISSCKHQFHFECLVNSFLNKFNKDLPLWLISHCPICQQSCNLLFPNTLLEVHFDQFIQDASATLIELNLDKELLTKHQGNEELIVPEMIYQLLINILIQMLVSKVDFQRSGKIQIFQQLLKILRYNYSNVKYQQKILNFKEGQIFILDIMLMIENYVMQVISKNEFQQGVQNILLSLPIQNDDIVKIFFNFFEIEFKEKLFHSQQYKISSKCIADFYQIQNEISNQIATLLGNNFEIFRLRYIKNLCKKCGFFNLNFQNSKDISVCLLCLKTYCLGSCNNNQSGNLSLHAEEEHNGHSLYVCLSSGKVVITSYPISLVNFFTLYYNNLGQELEQITDDDLDWDKYKLDMDKVDQISKIILLNQYQHIVRNALHDQHRQNIRRNL
ncbi:unnamed protein product (macronuclear) [Paramecium tetraurelia]|uniref:UBR-type domain-containing protein n=1 Tax=Paramecium tetraurelia TaxID=5888 RepID=A0BZ33_PARTE|nr:uncharacterized protein GSPATT00033653001 [Paramecium tetraurelia]CAK63800.1 unnamed protein product [Paramecium tetraurelia]|eukprot:XP_001431198.1 hypothetical protein (macronuclear) [Paramecium tetraurelia strain d4-2]